MVRRSSERGLRGFPYPASFRRLRVGKGIRRGPVITRLCHAGQSSRGVSGARPPEIESIGSAAMNPPEPLAIYDCSLLRCPTGWSCANVRELRNGM